MRGVGDKVLLGGKGFVQAFDHAVEGNRPTGLFHLKVHGRHPFLQIGAGFDIGGRYG